VNGLACVEAPLLDQMKNGVPRVEAREDAVVRVGARVSCVGRASTMLFVSPASLPGTRNI
jgi:hypothetical protein